MSILKFLSLGTPVKLGNNKFFPHTRLRLGVSLLLINVI